MKNAPLFFLAAALVVLASVALVWNGAPYWALLLVYLGVLVLWLYARYRRSSDALAQLKAERKGESFDSFLERLNRPDYDRRMVGLVCSAVRSLADLGTEDFALRPYDDLVRDLGIKPDDLGEALFAGLKGPLRLVDTPEALAANPHRLRRQTLGGLIDFYANHPKLSA